MQKFLLIGLIVGSAIAPIPLAALAQSASRQIPASQAQGQNQAPLQSLKLWTGYGLSLSFIATGERVQKVWLDDPSQVGMDFDSPLCSTSQSACAGGAMVIHLRRIAPVKFPQLLQTEGRTTLKVITQTAEQQRRLYQFQLLLQSGQPEYVTVEIVPDQGKVSNQTQFLNTFQAGLVQAERNQQISRQQPLWNRIQQFITLSRNGMAIEPAARTAGISLALIQRLTELGQSPSTTQP